MRWFHNLQLSRKVIGLLVLMALLTVGLLAFNIDRMGALDARHSALIDREVKAADSVSRMLAVSIALGRSTYQMIAEDDDQQTRALKQQIDAVEKRFTVLAESAVKADPELTAEINDLKGRFAAAFQVGAAVQEASIAQKDKEAMEIMKTKFEPALGKLTDGVRSLEETLNKRVDAASADATDAYHSARLATLVVGVIGLLFCFGAALILMKIGVSSPLAVLNESMTQLARGEMAVDIRGQERHDEIGAMARALQIFKDAAIEKARLVAAEEAELAKRAERQARVEGLTSAFDSEATGLLDGVLSSVQVLNQASEALSANAEQTKQQSAAVSAAAEQATSNVETVAAAGNELSASITEISRQVAESGIIASSAERDALAANGKIEHLAAAIGKISEVTELINGIAAQTNLLALNATIEAARAGEAGKGFAVVAAEVKNLANQTARATEEIAAQVGGIQSETSDAVAAIKDISSTIVRMREIATAIAGAVEEQGAATSEIVRNVEQAATGTRTVAENIAEVAKVALATGEMARKVLASSGEVHASNQTLRQEVEGFLHGVKQA